jgi:hypothetical protein
VDDENGGPLLSFGFFFSHVEVAHLPEMDGHAAGETGSFNWMKSFVLGRGNAGKSSSPAAHNYGAAKIA